MHYAGRRHFLADASPLRSMPRYRTVESVFGPSRQVCVEAELRNARAELVGEVHCYAKACAALGKANRMPVNWSNAGAGCRRYHQAEAMRGVNARRRILRAAERRVRAAEVAAATLTPADAFARPFLAKMAADRAALAVAA